MKYTYKNTCPCGDYEFKLIYITDGDEVQEIYCPFCSALIEDTIETDSEDDE